MVRAGYPGRMGPRIGRKSGVRWNAWNASDGGLPPGATFKRSTSACGVNAAGNLQVFSANTPRFEYHPLTLAFRGLRIEAAATNELLQSRNYLASWAAGGAGNLTITPGQLSKFGDNAATLLAADALTRRIEQALAVTTVSRYLGMIFKPGGTVNPYLRVDNNALAYQVEFDTATMTATPATGGGAGPVSNVIFESIGGGFYYGGFSYLPTGTASIARVYPRVGSITLDQVQHELGNTPSSPIVTGASQGTRDKDELTLALPYALNDVTFTFDDDTTQTVTGVTSPYVVPTLNRQWIKSIQVVSA